MTIKNDQIDLYREILGSYPTGVTVITTIDNNNTPVGLTVNSFASVSIDPLMILWCIDKGSGSYDTFINTKKFAVNILAGDQKDTGLIFASRKEENRFSKVEWEYSLNYLPIINDVFAILECEIVEQIDAGDHIIFIGKVIDLKKNDKAPMLYYQRNMGFAPKIGSSS